MLAGSRRPWFGVVGVCLCAGAILRLAVGPVWSLSELDQAASVGGFLLGAVGLWQGRLRSAARPLQELPVAATTEEGQHQLRANEWLQRLPRLGEVGLAVRALRVHGAVSLPGSPRAEPGCDDDLPMWIERDRAQEVRAWIRTAVGKGGGFLVIAGASSVGKTRLLYQAALDTLSGWPVLVPELGDGATIDAYAAKAGDLTEGIVIWLDEVYRFLPGPGLSGSASAPVTAGTIAQLLDASVPVVVLGSLWPEHLRTLRAHRKSEAGLLDEDQIEHVYPDAVDALRHAHIVKLESFSEAEIEKARAASAFDPRLAIATADPNFGVTQVLAGAPRLVERYETATGAQKAVLYAAIDARRLGITPPFSPELLTSAARGYLTAAHATDDWARPAFKDLVCNSGPSDRATAPLIEAYDPTHRQVIGYEVADYLLQHAAPLRRTVRIPDATWHALISHSCAVDDLLRLAGGAERRGLDEYAKAAYRKVVASGDSTATDDVFGGRVEVARLRIRADAGDERAADRLVDALANRSDPADVEELRARAAGHTLAANRLIDVLVKRGDVDELRARAAAGHARAADRLVDVLTARGEPEDVEELRARAGAGHAWAIERLVDTLASRGDVDDVEELRALADAGHARAARLLVDLLANWGEVEELRALADAGHARAARLLVDLLANWGEVEELRVLAEGGDIRAAHALVELLAEHGDVDELRSRADADDIWAAGGLADLLASMGELGELRALAGSGDKLAANRLVDVLAKRGDVGELRVLAEGGDVRAARLLVDLLADRRDADGLGRLADAGDAFADHRLVNLLADQRDVDGLRNRADAGNARAARLLVKFLADDLDVEGLRARANVGDIQAARSLVSALTELGEVDELRTLAVGGDERAARELANLLAELGEVDELRTLADTGDAHAVYRLVELLGERRDVNGLRARADAGDIHAAHRLVNLLADRGDLERLGEEVRAGTVGALAALRRKLEAHGGSGSAHHLW